jgi:hypothetical protein
MGINPQPDCMSHSQSDGQSRTQPIVYKGVEPTFTTPTHSILTCEQCLQSPSRPALMLPLLILSNLPHLVPLTGACTMPRGVVFRAYALCKIHTRWVEWVCTRPSTGSSGRTHMYFYFPSFAFSEFCLTFCVQDLPHELEPRELGYAAAYQAFMYWRQTSGLSHYDVDPELQRERLIGLAIAEGIYRVPICCPRS